jgi:hypothetical protein
MANLSTAPSQKDRVAAVGLRYGNKRWSVHCVDCGGFSEVGGQYSMPIEVTVPKFEKRGWTHNKGEWKCALHSITTKESPMDTSSPKIMRLVMSALETHFDDAKRRYSSGHSDASIAKDTGTSEAFVTKIRREAFGELAEDPELVDLKNRLDLMQKRIDNAVTVLVEMVSGKESELKEVLAALRNMLASIASKRGSDG